MVCCKQTGEIELLDFTKTKKKFNSKALAVALKKKTQDFSDFLQIWKFVGQISRLCQEFKSLHESWQFVLWGRQQFHTCITFLVHFFDVHCGPLLLAKISVLIWPAIEPMTQLVHPRTLWERMPGSYSQPSWVILKEPRAVGRWN